MSEAIDPEVTRRFGPWERVFAVRKHHAWRGRYDRLLVFRAGSSISTLTPDGSVVTNAWSCDAVIGLCLRVERDILHITILLESESWLGLPQREQLHLSMFANQLEAGLLVATLNIAFASAHLQAGPAVVQAPIDLRAQGIVVPETSCAAESMTATAEVAAAAAEVPPMPAAQVHEETAVEETAVEEALVEEALVEEALVEEALAACTAASADEIVAHLEPVIEAAAPSRLYMSPLASPLTSPLMSPLTSPLTSPLKSPLPPSTPIVMEALLAFHGAAGRNANRPSSGADGIKVTRRHRATCTAAAARSPRAKLHIRTS